MPREESGSAIQRFTSGAADGLKFGLFLIATAGIGGAAFLGIIFGAIVAPVELLMWLFPEIQEFPMGMNWVTLLVGILIWNIVVSMPVAMGIMEVLDGDE